MDRVGARGSSKGCSKSACFTCQTNDRIGNTTKGRGGFAVLKVFDRGDRVF